MLFYGFGLVVFLSGVCFVEDSVETGIEGRVCGR